MLTVDLCNSSIKRYDHPYKMLVHTTHLFKVMTQFVAQLKGNLHVADGFIHFLSNSFAKSTQADIINLTGVFPKSYEVIPGVILNG